MFDVGDTKSFRTFPGIRYFERRPCLDGSRAYSLPHSNTLNRQRKRCLSESLSRLKWESMAADNITDCRVCSVCQETRKDYKRVLKEPELFVVHIRVGVLSESLKKSEQKKRKLKEVEKIVSALRNNDGGDVLIHLEGHASNDKFLGHFDEFVDYSLNNLIPDGRLYIDTYTRQWLCDVPGFESRQHVIVLKVAQTKFVSTVDFKTKIPSDFKLEKPSTINIVSILHNKSFPEKSEPILKGTDNYERLLHENRSIELKLFMPKGKDVSTLKKFVNFIWDVLRFKEQLTSLSKVKGGGSCFVGVGEARDTKTDYDTKYIDPVGVVTNWSINEIQCTLRDKLREEVSMLTYDGKFMDVPEEMIEVACHQTNDKNIMEIAVGSINGIVFYEKKGPETYTIKEGKICRMDVEEWFRRISRMTINQVAKHIE